MNTSSRIDSARQPSPIRPFSQNDDHDYVIRSALGISVGGAGEPGEILAATAGISKHDHTGWFVAWQQLGERLLADADAASASNHRVSAAGAYLRASAYLSVAVNAISALADTSLLGPTFARQRQAWDGFVAHTAAEVENVAIPIQDDSLPGWLFRSPVASAPTLVAVNGSDGSLASLWASCVLPALERGYHVLLFDGPGQQSQFFERGIPFRADWENVLTPVYDFLAGLRGVDASRIALYGISQGSYWVARALAFEHRYVATITDPGLVDVSTSWTSHLPKGFIRLLDNGEVEKFDREMAVGMKLSPETARTWRFRARPYGTVGYGQTIEAVRAYTVADLAERISTPLLILDPAGEQFWPGQADQLAKLTAKVSTVIHFTADEGADEHCQPLARTLTAQRMFDWLDDRTFG